MGFCDASSGPVLSWPLLCLRRFWVFLIYPGCSLAVMQTFICRKVYLTTYLTSDYHGQEVIYLSSKRFEFAVFAENSSFWHSSHTVPLGWCQSRAFSSRNVEYTCLHCIWIFVCLPHWGAANHVACHEVSIHLSLPSSSRNFAGRCLHTGIACTISLYICA